MDLKALYLRIWSKLENINKLLIAQSTCEGDKDTTKRNYDKLTTEKEELEELVERVHVCVRRMREAQQAANNFEERASLLNHAANLLKIQLFGNEEADSSGLGTQESITKSVKVPPSNSFEIAAVSESELIEVPGYLKGRITVSQVNDCIKLINNAVKKKYEILKKPIKSLKMKEKVMQEGYKKQNTAMVKGMHFVTVDDMKEFSNFKVNTTNSSVLKILRHLRRMKEIREAKEPIRYVVLKI